MKEKKIGLISLNQIIVSHPMNTQMYLKYCTCTLLFGQ